MIRLTNTTTDLLVCTPSSTNVVKTMVSYSDKTATTYTGNSEPHSLAAASKATICGTPAASTVRDIDHIAISASGGANTITVLKTISGTDYQILSAVLATNETLEYTHAGGWHVLDVNGAVKYQLSGLSVASGKAANILNSLSFAGTDGTTMTFPTTSATIARTDAANTFAGTQTVTSAVAGDAVIVTNAAASNKTLYLNTGNQYVGIFDGAGTTGNGFFTDAINNKAFFQINNATALTLTSSGFALGALHLSRAGTAAGLSLDTSNNATFSAQLSATGLINANAGISVPTGQNITGAGTAKLEGFARIGIGASSTSTSVVHISGLPTSSAGLASGDVWLNSNVLTIVP